MLDPRSVSWTEILQSFDFGPLLFCRSTGATLLFLSTVELFVFQRAMKLNDNDFVELDALVMNSTTPLVEKLFGCLSSAGNKISRIGGGNPAWDCRAFELGGAC